MNNAERLVEVLREISIILNTHGHADFAGRLDEQAQLLTDSSNSAESVKQVHERLHSAVHGMGGLLDLWLSAPTHAESVSAREELDELCDELYELTK